MNILGLPDDGRDLLLAAALGSRDRALEAWARWTAASDGRSDPVAERWLPLIAVNLHGVDLDATSRRRLNEARRQTWAANVRVRSAADPVLHAFAAAGIPAMLIKGAALENAVYPQPGMRLLGDIDVLVPRAAAIAARTLMRQMDWIPGRPLDACDTTIVHGLNYSRSPYGEVDLHWNLLRECCWPDAEAGVWSRATRTSTAAPAVFVPSPADLLLHACVHGLRWSPVHSAHWVADAYYIIQRAGDRLDWQVVIDEARSRGLVFQVRESLALVERVTAVHVPLDVLRALVTPRWAIGERLECRVKGLPPSSLGGVYALWRDWRRTRWPASADKPTLGRYLRITIGNDRVRQMAPRVFRWFVRAVRVRRPPVSGASSRPAIAKVAPR